MSRGIHMKGENLLSRIETVRDNWTEIITKLLHDKQELAKFLRFSAGMYKQSLTRFTDNGAITANGTVWRTSVLPLKKPLTAYRFPLTEIFPKKNRKIFRQKNKQLSRKINQDKINNYKISVTF